MQMNTAAKTLNELAAHVGGEVEGDGNLLINSVMPIEEATEGCLTFLANDRYVRNLATTKASAIIVSPKYRDIGKPVIVIANPYLAFARIVGLFAPPATRPVGVHPSAVVSPSARLGRDVAILPHAYVGAHAVLGERVVLHPGAYVGDHCSIGDGSEIYANAVIYEGCVLGKGCVIHANAVIGNMGLGYAPDPAAGEGKFWRPVPQVGNVVLEEGVEIGPCTSVNRAAMRSTIIRRGTKIGGHVAVAHNVEIGEDTIIVDQAGIAGSVKIGKRVTLAGQVGIVGHLEIGDHVTVAAQSGVTRDLPGGATYLGSPAIPIEESRKVYGVMANLPKLRKKVHALEQRLAQLEARLGEAVPEAD
jgi:UDP-3-O-[3-hydroxymyristoyl] glucosamine N-acyltransferase